MVEASLFSTFAASAAKSNDAAANDTTEKNGETSNKKPSSVGIFQDAITVIIPLNLTVDLGIAMRRSRKKRIDAIYAAYPSLKTQQEKSKEATNDDEDGEEDGGGGGGAAGGDSDEMEGTGESAAAGDKKTKPKKSAAKKQQQNVNQPQRHEFGSIMDYLEAKYVRGVMIENEGNKRKSGGEEDGKDDDNSKTVLDDEDDEGEGSVYSESSFLDDRDLQRDVAEQVLAQTTTTKLELDGDADFFVNVGDLDVEENEFGTEHYDPLEDSPSKKPKNTKKRKKPSSTTETSSSPPKKKKAITKKKEPEKQSPKKKKKSKEPEKKSPKKADKQSPKKKKSTDEKKKQEKEKEKKKPAPKVKKEKPKPTKEVKDGSDSDSSKEEPVAAPASPKKAPKKNSGELKKLRTEAAKHKKIMEKRFEKIKLMIKAMTTEQLPRKRPQKSKVSITCPANKKEGDEITFANPHIPGQRLKVKVPKGISANETFKVTVPKPEVDEGEGDQNRFPRDLQDELDLYAREYDMYCKHEGEFRHAKDEEYPIHLEKRKKYDQVVKVFPRNLKTPIDSEYMKKLVRRARQNKSKRTKSAAVRRQSEDASPNAPTQGQQQQGDASDEENDNHDSAAGDNSDDEEDQPSGDNLPPPRKLDVPQRGLVFPEKAFSILDFQSSVAGGHP